ncbi:MAG: hypothetical protein WBD31_27670 [Rubripirellula sp.]
MTNLTNPKVIWFKGGLFAGLGLLASGLLIARAPEWQTTLLLMIAIWAFCRAYYFAFYVIQHYVDPSFRFAGLIDFARYALLGKAADRRENDTTPPN